jgi:hypothetical protein
MAITSLIAPSTFAPAFTPFKVTFVSDNFAEPNFRYLVELTNGTETARFNIAPQQDGSGFMDISRVVDNWLEAKKITGNWADALNTHLAEVNIAVGEIYSIDWTYTDIQQNGLYVELVGVSTPTFVTGDQIKITQSDGGIAMPNMEGLFVVVSVSGDDVTISRLWSDITYSAVGGSVIYADNRNTEFPNLDDIDVSFICASLGADKLTDSVNTTQRIWTGADGLTLYSSQDVFATVFQGMTADPYKVRLTAYDSDGQTYLYTYDVDNDSECQIVRLWGDFGAVTTLGSATLPVIKPTTLRLEVGVRQGTQTNSKIYTFYNDNRCRVYDYEILFLDLYGGWGSFAFELFDTKTIQTQREGYRNNNEDIQHFGKRWQELVLNTNYMTRVNSLYFDQLVTSREVYVKINSVYYKCKVLEDSVVIEERKNLIKKAIRIKVSNEILING